MRAMSRYAKALDHGGRGWDIVRYVRADLTQQGNFRRDASLVLDEGVLDVLQASPGVDARQVMNAYVERAAGLVRQGGALIVVGYAGNPAVVNQTTLGFLLDEAASSASAGDPRRACSPWGPGAVLPRALCVCTGRANNARGLWPRAAPAGCRRSPHSALAASREVLVRRVVVEVVEVEEAPVHADEDDVVRVE